MENTMNERGIADDISNGEPAGKKFHPGFKKNLMVVGVIFAVAILVTIGVLTYLFSSAPPESQSGMSLPARPEQKNSEGNAQYNKLVEEKNMEDQKKAEQKGGTFFPVIIDKPENVQPDTFGVGQNMAGISATGTAPQSAQPPQAAQSQEDGGARGNIHYDAMMQIKNQWSPPSKGAQQISILDDVQQVSATKAALTPAPATTPNQVAQVAATEKKPPNYEANLLIAFSGAFDKPVRTDTDPRVILTLHSGPYVGAKLMGRAKRAVSTMNIELTQMKFNGVTYAVNGVVLDEETLSEAVPGVYNRELFDRHVLPLLFDFAGGYADARSQTGTSAVASIGGVGQTTPPPNSSQAIASGVKSMMDTAEAIVSEDKPVPHVDNPRFKSVAVMFMQ